MYFQSEIFIISEIAALLFSSEDDPTLFWKVDILVQNTLDKKAFFIRPDQFVKGFSNEIYIGFVK